VGVVEGTNLLAGNDERVTRTKYVNDAGRWLLGRATDQRVEDGSGRKLSETLTGSDHHRTTRTRDFWACSGALQRTA